MELTDVIFTPRRRRGVEHMDSPCADQELTLRSLRDVALANRLFGGTSAVISEMRRVPAAEHLTWLDVGSGTGDIPAHFRAEHPPEAELTSVILDRAEAPLRAREDRVSLPVVADAVSLPFPTGAFHTVTCSQLLHHFQEPELGGVIRELDRVASDRVIISDIRRSWLAAAGIWAVSFPLRFHSVSRHDGVVSVLRGFTAAELSRLVGDATGVVPRVREHRGFRVTASWQPSRDRE